MYASPVNTGRKNERFGSGRPAPARSQLMVNLRKLVDAMDLDLLAASLGIRESMLQDILSGKDNGDDYRQFLSQKLDEAGFAHNWLDRVNAQVFPDQIKELRTLASQSDRKAPLRKDNLKTLMAAFDGKLDILADALEVVPNALLKVVQGELILDDQRFGHFNPILMRAGFSDGWLDSANAKLEDSWIAALTKMAETQYDEYLTKIETQAAAEKDNASKAQSLALLSSSITLPKPNLPEEKFAMKAFTIEPNETASKPGLFVSGPNTLSGKEPPVFKQKSNAPALQTLAQGLAATKPAQEVKAKVSQDAQIATKPMEVPFVIAKKLEAKQKAEVPSEDKKSISALRTQRLESLMKQARRGARSHLWITCLNRTMALSYNLENGKVEFTDELANQITTALGLPQGWLDQENGNPLLAAAWVFDKEIDLKTVKPAIAADLPAEEKITNLPPVKKISQLKPAPVTAAKKAQKQSQAVLKLEEPVNNAPVSLTQTAAPVFKQVDASTTISAIQDNHLTSTRGKAKLKSTSELLEELPVLAKEVAVQAEPTEPAFAKNAQASPESKESTTPAALHLPPVAIMSGELGPLAKVLLHTIELQARQGKLTEQQALEIIYKIS